MSNPPFPEITVVVGSGRSGTSYLQNVLAGTVSLGFGPEPQFIARLHSRLDSFGDLSQELNLRRLVDEMLRAPFFDKVRQQLRFQTTAEDVLNRVLEPSYRGVLYALFQNMADKQGYARLGYKDPRDTLHLKLISQLLPTARFVHIIRDGRDVAMSLRRWRFGPTNLYTGSAFWSRRTDIGQRDGQDLRDRYHELRFEDLVSDPESVGPPLVDFIIRERDEETVKAFVEHVLATRRPDTVYRWKEALSLKDRSICEAAAGRTLRACGYQTEFENPRVNPLHRAYYVSSDIALRGIRRVARETRRIEAPAGARRRARAARSTIAGLRITTYGTYAWGLGLAGLGPHGTARYVLRRS